MPIKSAIKDNRDSNFVKEEINLEKMSDENLFEGLTEKWQESDPLTAPSLSELNQNREKRQIYSTKEIKNVIMFPIHHLIPAEKLSSVFLKTSGSIIKSQTAEEYRNRRRMFWESLAENSVDAKYAAFLDDSLWCRFNDLSEEKIVEVDWEVLYYDDLQGCGEIYRAEMLSFKRLVYEADSELRKVLEIKDQEFLQYYSPDKFGNVEIEYYKELFFDSLIAPFTITVSGFKNINNEISNDESYIKSSKNKQNSRVKKKLLSETFDFYRAFSAKRIESWMSEEYNAEKNHNGDEVDKGCLIIPDRRMATQTLSSKKKPSQAKETPKNHDFSTTYRLSLTDYWFEWQRAAKRSDFDFDLLSNLSDARAVRFYELTKLWRAVPDAEKTENFTRKTLNKTSKNLPKRMEIGYEKFAALMPIPYLRYENEIKQQIKELIEPLKECGYVKSFALKSDWRGFFSGGKLIFSFMDQ